MKIDCVICSLERVIYEYVGHLRARTPTINVSVATHDLFWVWFVCAFIRTRMFSKRVRSSKPSSTPKKIYSARCLYDFMCSQTVWEAYVLWNQHTHVRHDGEKNTNGLQFQFNSLTKYGNVYTINIFTPFGLDPTQFEIDFIGLPGLIAATVDKHGRFYHVNRNH